MGDTSDENGKNNGKSKKRKIAGIHFRSVLCSAFKKMSTIAVIYFVGYMQWSMGWFMGPVVLLVIRDQYRKITERRCKIAQSSALAKEEDVVLARLDDLPSWVFFPDIERAEWVNTILKQLWPNVNKYVNNMIRDKIQPKIAKKLQKYKLSGFQFENMILGSIPPRIGGVKVYEHNVSRNEIILDVDLFYAGDCNLTFSMSGFRGGIKDFQLEGMARIVLKPLLTKLPLVGGLQFYFLNHPTIDFNLVGVIDILDMPGFSDLLRQLICEQVASMMVLPNKLPIKLSKHVEAEVLHVPLPEGILRMHVVEAKNLMKKDIGILGKGKSDPYAVLNVGAQEHRTQTIDNTVDPKWDYWCEFPIMDSNGQQLFVHLFDYDDGTKDDDLGRATIDIGTIVRKGEDDMWITLEQAKHGMIHVRFTWLVLTTDYSDLKAAIEETQQLQVTTMSTALLIVYVDSAKNLPQARTQSKPDVYLLLTAGKHSQQTSVKKKNSDPVWEEGFSFLIANPDSDTLYLNVIDHKTGAGLGQLTYNINALSEKPDLRVHQQPFGLLKSGPESKLIFSMHLKILKRAKPMVINEDDGDHNTVDFNRQDSTSSNAPFERSNSSKQVLSRNASLKSNSDSAGNLPEGEDFCEESNVLLQSATPPHTPTDTVVHRQISVTSSAGEAGLGRIQLTLRYSVQRQRLIIIVHKIANLPISKDPTNIPDPYVKLYLLPARAKETKRKTTVIKDNYNPVYDATFEYIISQGELHTQQLEVTVATQKQLFSGSNIMGQVIIDLNEFNLTQSNTFWYDLQPEIDN